MTQVQVDSSYWSEYLYMKRKRKMVVEHSGFSFSIFRSVQDLLSYGCDKNKNNEHCGLWVLSSTLLGEEFKQFSTEMLSDTAIADGMCQYMAKISEYKVRQ